MNKTAWKGKTSDKGFTLIEMIVAVALFSAVMLISTAALLALVGASRKAQALQSVMNNLNIALDGMVRSVRMGSNYHCGSGSYVIALDCANGETTLAFEAFDGDPNDATDQWVYTFDPATKRIYKSEDGGAHLFAITAPTVTIDSLKFYVVGTARGASDPLNEQPKVVIQAKGTAGAQKVKTTTSFNIQATAVQRLLDL